MHKRILPLLGVMLLLFLIAQLPGVWGLVLVALSCSMQINPSVSLSSAVSICRGCPLFEVVIGHMTVRLERTLLKVSVLITTAGLRFWFAPARWVKIWKTAMT
jgi:hypothetical protein